MNTLHASVVRLAWGHCLAGASDGLKVKAGPAAKDADLALHVNQDSTPVDIN